MTTPHSTAAARESARRGNGEFGTQERGEADVSLVDVDPSAQQAPDYTSWTAVEVDTELARLYDEHGKAMSRWSSQYGFVNSEIARNVFNRGFGGKCSRAEMHDTLDQMQRDADAAEEAGTPRDIRAKQTLDHWDTAGRYEVEASRLEAEMVPFNAEFERRGGWSRAFLVSNTNGHVHSSMNCSTCFETGYDQSGNWREGTRFHWVTSLSDHDESEIIEAAGSDACTVCYPSARVEALERPRSVFTPDEERKAEEKAERARVKAERDAKRIEKALTPDGSPLRVETGNRYTEDFKTEQAATTWAVTQMSYERAVGWGKPMDDATRGGVDTVVAAIAAKHGKTEDEVRADLDKKMRAKAKREDFKVT